MRPRTIKPDDTRLVTVACLCGAWETSAVVTCTIRDPQSDAPVSFHVVQCQRCGLQFQNPRPTDDYLKAFYPDNYYAYVNADPPPTTSYQAFWERLQWWTKVGMRRAFCGYPSSGGWAERWMWRGLLWPLWIRTVCLGLDFKIMPYQGRGRFLEIGCGTGSGLFYQQQYGLQVRGVEMSPSAVEVARTRYGLDVRVGTLEEAQFTERSFDLIYMSHVFEHVTDPVTTLAAVHRVLDTEGLLLLKLPNMASVSARRFGAYWLGLDLPRHLYHFTPQSLTALLQRHGFVVNAIRQDIGSWGFWRESRRLRARELGQAPPADSWWSDRVDRITELCACWRGLGSNIMVYAQKAPASRWPSGDGVR